MREEQGLGNPSEVIICKDSNFKAEKLGLGHSAQHTD